jgi:hypothetical protein
MTVNKKTFIATTIITALLILLVGIQDAEMAKANFAPPIYFSTPTISKISLDYGTVYPSNPNLIFSFNVTHETITKGNPHVYSPTITNFNYIVDEGEEVRFEPKIISTEIVNKWTLYGDFYEANETQWLANVSLHGLGNGWHSLIVKVNMELAINSPTYPLPTNLTSYPLNFEVDTCAPVISNLSIENRTYNTAQIPLIFSINEPTSQLLYVLDRTSNTTILGNATLTKLADGSHSLIVYATDTAGNIGKSDTIFFIVRTPTPSPSPSPSPSISISPTPSDSPTQQPTIEHSPTANAPLGVRDFPSSLLVIAIIIVVITAVAGLLVYFKKIKK